MLIRLLNIFLIFTLSGAAAQASNNYFSGICRIYDHDGKILSVFPGKKCLFLDDGSFLSLSSDSLRSFTNSGAVEWEFPVFHNYAHVNFTEDKKILLVTYVKRYGFLKNVLLVYVLNREGKVLHHTAIQNFTDEKEYLSVSAQLFQIPKLNLPHAPAWLKEGNLILTGKKSGVLVLGPDLKKKLHTVKFPTSRNQDVSDMQFTEEGNLFYLNRNASDSSELAPGSSVEEMNLVTGKVTYRYPEVPHALFYIPIGGTIDLLGFDKILINHPFTGIYIIAKKEKKILRYMRNFHYELSGLRPTESIHTDALTLFLKNWKL